MAFSRNPNFADGNFADGKFCRWILQMAFWGVLEFPPKFCVLWSEQTCFLN